MKNLLSWTNKHSGVMALVGGFCSMTAGATWWLANGGAAAFLTSMGALGEPEIATTLVGLPEYHARTELTLAGLVEGQRQVLDGLEALRLQNETIVEWAPEHSQRLTDAVGGCYAGEDCTVYFRGRATQTGASCDLVNAKPRLVLPDGREFPVAFRNDFERLDLGTRFETVEAVVAIPPFVEPGLVGVVVLTVYADCPFVTDGKRVERETFRLLIEIKAR
ncbi:hypothetical protein [Shimia sp.]|uniref:hypothetical protein n=1 Tax=Shimia sp. TaxID=1954381 RepID=UPI00329A487E